MLNADYTVRNALGKMGSTQITRLEMHISKMGSTRITRLEMQIGKMGDGEFIPDNAFRLCYQAGKRNRRWGVNSGFRAADSGPKKNSYSNPIQFNTRLKGC